LIAWRVKAGSQNIWYFDKYLGKIKLLPNKFFYGNFIDETEIFSVNKNKNVPSKKNKRIRILNIFAGIGTEENQADYGRIDWLQW
jgi:hypothetical protein